MVQSGWGVVNAHAHSVRWVQAKRGNRRGTQRTSLALFKHTHIHTKRALIGRRACVALLRVCVRICVSPSGSQHCARLTSWISISSGDFFFCCVRIFQFLLLWGDFLLLPVFTFSFCADHQFLFVSMWLGGGGCLFVGLCFGSFVHCSPFLGLRTAANLKTR